MKLTARLLNLVLLVSTALLAPSCESNKSGGGRSLVDNGVVYCDFGGRPVLAIDWWNYAAGLGKYAAIGSARSIGSPGGTRNRADFDARNKLADSIKASIQSISESMSQEAGDLTGESSLSAIMSDEAFIQEVVETTLAGAAAARYQSAEKRMYVLIKLGNPDDFLTHLTSKVDELYEQDSAREGLLRDSLDVVIQRERTAIPSEQAKTAKVLGPSSSMEP